MTDDNPMGDMFEGMDNNSNDGSNIQGGSVLSYKQQQLQQQQSYHHQQQQPSFKNTHSNSHNYMTPQLLYENNNSNNNNMSPLYQSPAIQPHTQESLFMTHTNSNTKNHNMHESAQYFITHRQSGSENQTQPRESQSYQSNRSKSKFTIEHSYDSNISLDRIENMVFKQKIKHLVLFIFFCVFFCFCFFFCHHFVVLFAMHVFSLLSAVHMC